MVHSAVGHVIDRDGVEVVEAPPGESGYALFGPYCSLDAGRYTVEFHIEIPANHRSDVNDDALCGFIEVVNSAGQRVFANKPLLGTSLKNDSAAHFVDFNLDAREEGIEFRVYVTGRAPLLLAENRQVAVTLDGNAARLIEAYDDFVEYDARDPVLMYKHNIRCDIGDNSHGNSVALGNREAISANQLRLSIRGNNNSIRLTENTLPTGAISCLGSGSTCKIVGSGSLTLELFLYDGAKFYLGKDTVVFGLAASVYNNTSCYIGDGCLFANQISMWTADHHSIIDLRTRQQINFPGDIRIGNHVWLGQGTHILKRVSIGDGSIIAARSLVNRAVPPTELWGGVPAKCIRKGVSWVSPHPATEFDIATMMRSLEPQC